MTRMRKRLMTDNRLIRELGGALCQLLTAFKANTPIPPSGSREERECLKAISRAERALHERREWKEAKRA